MPTTCTSTSPSTWQYHYWTTCRSFYYSSNNLWGTKSILSRPFGATERTTSSWQPQILPGMWSDDLLTLEWLMRPSPSLCLHQWTFPYITHIFNRLRWQQATSWRAVWRSHQSSRNCNDCRVTYYTNIITTLGQNASSTLVCFPTLSTIKPTLPLDIELRYAMSRTFSSTFSMKGFLPISELDLGFGECVWTSFVEEKRKPSLRQLGKSFCYHNQERNPSSVNLVSTLASSVGTK